VPRTCVPFVLNPTVAPSTQSFFHLQFYHRLERLPQAGSPRQRPLKKKAVPLLVPPSGRLED
jgi:hypothetical protein